MATMKTPFGRLDGRYMQSGRGVTKVVAASDSDDRAQWQADYLCDGTADDVEIQAAIDACNTLGGGEVCLMEGNFALAGGVRLYSNISIRGSGRGSTILTSSLTEPILQLADPATRAYHITIENVSIDNTDKANSGGIGIDFTFVTGGVISDVLVTNCEYGIKISGTAYWSLVDNAAVEDSSYGIYIVNGANDTHINNGKVDRCTTGITVDGSSNVQIISTLVEVFTTGITVGPSVVCTSPKIIGCRLENVPTSGTGVVLGNVLHPVLVGLYFQGLSTNVNFGSNTDVTCLGAYGGLNRIVNLIGNGINAFDTGDTSPSIAQALYWKTANTSLTLISALDGGTAGQFVCILIDDDNTLIDFTGGSLVGNAGVDYKARSGDILLCWYNGTSWHIEICGTRQVTTGSALMMSGSISELDDDTYTTFLNLKAPLPSSQRSAAGVCIIDYAAHVYRQTATQISASRQGRIAIAMTRVYGSGTGETEIGFQLIQPETYAMLSGSAISQLDVAFYARVGDPNTGDQIVELQVKLNTNAPNTVYRTFDYSATLLGQAGYDVANQYQYNIEFANSPGDAPYGNTAYSHDVPTFTSGDATPSVRNSNIFKTNNSAGTTITMLDDGFVRQEVVVIFGDGNTTIDFTETNLKGNGGADWSPALGDHMTCIFDGTNWYCDVSDNTA